MLFKLSDIATIFIAANSHTLQVQVSHLYVRVEKFELTTTGTPIDLTISHFLYRALKSHALSARLMQTNSNLHSHRETVISHSFKVPCCFSQVPT